MLYEVITHRGKPAGAAFLDQNGLGIWQVAGDLIIGADDLARRPVKRFQFLKLARNNFV